MKTQIVKIGNSQGIRIPKILLEQSGLQGEVELDVSQGRIIIRSVTNPREGWAKAFKQMAARSDDVLLDGDMLQEASFDTTEWDW